MCEGPPTALGLTARRLSRARDWFDWGGLGHAILQTPGGGPGTLRQLLKFEVNP